MVKKSLSDITAKRSGEQVDRLHEIKEILRGQKAEVMASYASLVDDLGIETISEQDYDRTLSSSLKKWESDGSLRYLSLWLKQNPGHVLYMSASPNITIPLEAIIPAAEKLTEKNIAKFREEAGDSYWQEREYYKNHFEVEFLLQYSEEELCGKPALDGNGSPLPARLSVWTDKYNLDEVALDKQSQRLEEVKRVVGSASDQTILQTMGHWYRLRESEDFGGVGLITGKSEAGSGSQYCAKPMPGSHSQKCVPTMCVDDDYGGVRVVYERVDLSDKMSEAYRTTELERFIITS